MRTILVFVLSRYVQVNEACTRALQPLTMKRRSCILGKRCPI
jgi:hypothetical protein